MPDPRHGLELEISVVIFEHQDGQDVDSQEDLMQPLDREQSFENIRRLFSSASRVVIAAPYFGVGPHKLLPE